VSHAADEAFWPPSRPAAETWYRSTVKTAIDHDGDTTMTVLAEYDHDVFISYAHLDDRGARPWISTLVENLKLYASPRLGRQLRVWMDHELAGNDPVTPALIGAIQRSATLLVVMSRGYLQSEWCCKERNAFLSVAADRIAEQRVFVVDAWETDRSEMPGELRDLKGFPFWVQDSGAGGFARPLGLIDVQERRYHERLIDLSAQLVKRLQSLEVANTTIETGAANPFDTVFIARSTDDLEDREEELNGYLSQAGIERLPKKWYPDMSEAAFRAAMNADLQRSSVFVQLLGKAHGRKPEFGGECRYPALQSDLARACGKPVLQWRDPRDDPADVSDAVHRALLEDARACSFEDFKSAVVELARRKPVEPKPKPPGVTVFVNADRNDLEVAQRVAEVLAQKGVECYWPLREGSPEAVRQDLEENLKDCDGLILVYGTTEPSWVRDQLRQGRKILSQRERALAAMAIYLGPPEQKKEIAVALPNLITLDGRTGLNATAFETFLQRVTSGV
jgi:hypothetical protein